MTSAAVNALGQKLLLKWREEHPTESIVFSPLAAAATFCLIREGAAGETKDALDATLCLPVSLKVH